MGNQIAVDHRASVQTLGSDLVQRVRDAFLAQYLLSAKHVKQHAQQVVALFADGLEVGRVSATAEYLWCLGCAHDRVLLESAQLSHHFGLDGCCASFGVGCDERARKLDPVGRDVVERHLVCLQLVSVVGVDAYLRRVLAEDDAVRANLFYESDVVGQMVLLTTQVVFEYVHDRAVDKLWIGAYCIVVIDERSYDVSAYKCVCIDLFRLIVN